MSAPRKIAIVGSGISGLVAAHLLHGNREIALFEAGDHIGGHTHTHEVEQEGRRYAVDTGFIVYNEKNYPLFTRLLAKLGVQTQPTQMSFSVQCARTGLEYNGTSLNRLFAQRRNLVSTSFHRMLRDIRRFYRQAPELLSGEDRTTLGEYLERGRYSDEFVQQHIIPMGAAIWSAAPGDMYQFPARHFIRFFHNHGFLQWKGRPQWRVVRGGSQRYVQALTRPFAGCIRLRTPIRSIRRHPACVEIRPHQGPPERFDAAIIAVHSDQALRLLEDPTPAERQILGAMRYQQNETVLHTDERLLPRSRRAWASWNYYLPDQGCAPAPTVTYNMNILQGLKSARPFCVSLNRHEQIDPSRIVQRMTYHHPVCDIPALDAQARCHEISGANRTYYCGAYWGSGFHEDGAASAVEVARHFGEAL